MTKTLTVMACLSFAGAVTAASVPQGPIVTVDGDRITMTGCIVPAAEVTSSPEALFWGRGGLMLAGAGAAAAPAPNAIAASGMSGRVFYWLDDDEDLRKHLGKRVEIKGELEDLEDGEIEVSRDGDFTEIELDIDGDKEKARVPTSWFGGATPKDAEFKIAVREVDVDEVRELGACTR
jgi:hypothetical protein